MRKRIEKIRDGRIIQIKSSKKVCDALIRLNNRVISLTDGKLWDVLNIDEYKELRLIHESLKRLIVKRRGTF